MITRLPDLLQESRGIRLALAQLQADVSAIRAQATDLENRIGRLATEAQPGKAKAFFLRLSCWFRLVGRRVNGRVCGPARAWRKAKRVYP